MLKKSLIIQDPLKLLGLEADQALHSGGCGAIFARAGVGKTALLVQMAINKLLQEQDVLHVSLKDPVDKVDLWYKEVFQTISRLHEVQEVNRLWDEMLPHRFIMAFDKEAFSLDRLAKKISELKAQEIFSPRSVMIDGFAMADADSEALSGFKEFVRNEGLTVWFTIRGHRGDAKTPDAFAQDFARRYDDFFDAILQLSPEKDQIQVKPLKKESEHPSTLFLDPSTLLIRENRL